MAAPTVAVVSGVVSKTFLSGAGAMMDNVMEVFGDVKLCMLVATAIVAGGLVAINDHRLNSTMLRVFALFQAILGRLSEFQLSEFLWHMWEMFAGPEFASYFVLEIPDYLPINPHSREAFESFIMFPALDVKG